MDTKQGSSFITAIISYAAGDQMPNLVADPLSAQDQIIFFLQCIAFSVTIIAGLFTIYFSYKKMRNGKGTVTKLNNSDT